MTSNLIAYWELQRKREELGEELRHNLETESQGRRKLAIDEALGKLNAQVSQFRADEEARHNLAQERLSAQANYLTGLRISNDYTLAERKRVTDSFLTQKKLNEDVRLKNKQLELERDKYKWQRAKDVADIGIGLVKLIADPKFN